MKKMFFFLIAIVAIISSCKKEDNLSHGPYRDMYFLNETSNTLYVHINGSGFTLEPGKEIHLADGENAVSHWGKTWEAYIFVPYQGEIFYASGIVIGRNIIK